MNKTHLKNMAKIWFVGTLCSLVPFGHVSLVFGQPAVILSTFLCAYIFNKELSRGKDE